MTFTSLLTLVLLNPDIPCFANRTSEEANWSGSALFAIQNVNLYQQSVSRNLIGWNLKRAWHLNLFSRTRVNNLSVISRRYCDVAGSSMLTFRVLPHWNISPQTLDKIFHPVTQYWHWADKFWFLALLSSQSAFYVNLYRAVTGLSG